MLTPHFTWEEATRTVQRDPKTGLLLPNEPGPQEREALLYTFTGLERVRSWLHDAPIVVHSAFRSPALNAAVGGAPNSQHQKGEAVDFVVPGLTPREVVESLSRSPLAFDQLIEEAASWVHISFVARRQPRRQVLTMRVVEGRAKYEPLALA